jgi:hypothetical protein
MGLIKQNLQSQETEEPPPPDDMGEPPESAQTDGSAPDDDETESAGPEYEKFIAAAKVILFKEGGLAERIAKTLKASDDPVAALADEVYRLVAALDERSGGMLADELLAPAAADILGMVAEIAMAAEVELTTEQVSQAMISMVERYMKESGEDPEGQMPGQPGPPAPPSPPSAQAPPQSVNPGVLAGQMGA